jgi:cystathionine beta-lyase/cystathionine gamma-synthase
MTHASLTPSEREALEITDDLLRLSVGIEDVSDLVGDLAYALDATSQRTYSRVTDLCHLAL